MHTSSYFGNGCYLPRKIWYSENKCVCPFKLQQIEPITGQVDALVLCHTRELTYQNINVDVFYGGVNIKIHKDLLKNECPHVVVETSGRILGLARDKDLSLRNVRHLILDECDKILESLDMRRDVQEIFKMTPHDKQVMIFGDI